MNDVANMTKHAEAGCGPKSLIYQALSDSPHVSTCGDETVLSPLDLNFHVVAFLLVGSEGIGELLA